MSEYNDAETGEIVCVNYRRSPGINELFTALSKAQGMFDNAEKTGKGNFGKYATLAAILEATKDGREKNSLAFIQIPSNGTGNNITVTTILGHSSGQWIESTLAVAPTKFDAQGAGSAITYLRKYAAGAILGVAPEDDDGAAASIEQPKGVTRIASPRPIPAATRPATSAANVEVLQDGRIVIPGLSSTDSDGPPKWVAKFFAGDSYEIDPQKAGGWSAWEKFYCTVADAADNFDQLMKLDDDNKVHCSAFRVAVREAVYNRFREVRSANAKRLMPSDRFVEEPEKVFEG